MDERPIFRRLIWATPLNALLAALALPAGLFTLASWPIWFNLSLGAALLVFTGGAWVHYARGQPAQAAKYLRLSLALDLLLIAWVLLETWLFPGLNGWQ